MSLMNLAFPPFLAGLLCGLALARLASAWTRERRARRLSLRARGCRQITLDP